MTEGNFNKNKIILGLECVLLKKQDGGQGERREIYYTTKKSRKVWG